MTLLPTFVMRKSEKKKSFKTWLNQITFVLVLILYFIFLGYLIFQNFLFFQNYKVVEGEQVLKEGKVHPEELLFNLATITILDVWFPMSIFWWYVALVGYFLALDS